MSWVDIVILGWLALGAFKGFRAGLFRSVARLAGFFVSIILAMRNAPTAALFLQEQTAAGKIVSSLVERTGMVPPEAADLPAEQAVKAFTGLLAGLPGFGSWSIPTAAAGMTFGEYIQGLVTFLVLETLAFLLIIVGVYLVVDLVGRLLQGMFRLVPGGWVVNNGVGLVFGLAESAVVASLVVGALSPLLRLIPQQADSGPLSESLTAPTLLRLYQWLVALM